MRKIIAILIGVFLSSTTAYAHPPQDIQITFDAKAKMLSAVIVHNVSNPATHFIKEVDIALNGKEIIKQKMSRQDNNVSQSVMYVIPDANEGDLISVEGYCSISGKLSKEIKVQ
jgi:RNA-binding protein YhbY